MSAGYSGDVTPKDCWSRLGADRNSFLVDVRSRPEWTFVGTADLETVGKAPILAEWQTYPSMSVDPNFVSLVAETIARAGGDKDSELYFLCRSGQRSAAAAGAMAAEGYRACFNILGGFEGPPDEDRHRGKRSGWKADGLPWAQN